MSVPIVLLPGIRGVREEHRALLATFAGLDVQALDLPPLTAASTSLHDVARALLPALPRWPFVLVGASFGGLVGRALADLGPGGPPLVALVTIGTLPVPSPVQARCRWWAPVVRRLPGRVYRELYGARARADWLEDDPDPERYAALPLPSPPVLAARLHAIGAWGLSGRVSVPALCLTGATDRYARWSPAEVEALGATPVVVPGGHRPHLSHPAEVASHVRSLAQERPAVMGRATP